MNKRINTLAMAKEIQKRYNLPSLYEKYVELRLQIYDKCREKNITFNKTNPGDKYISYPPNNKLFDPYSHKICFCDKKKAYTEVCFHFTTRPCDEDITYVYCWHEDGTIKKHKIGNCPHSTYTIAEE